MTQTMFAPPPVQETELESPSPGGSRRTVLVAGAVVAALALGGGGYMLLSGGSSDVPSAAPVTHFGNPAAKPAAKKATTPTAVKPAVKVPVTSTVPLGRDPFHALYIAPVAAAPASSTTATVPTTTTGTTTTTTPTTTTTQPTAPKSYRLVLTGVSGSGKNLTATFNVGGKLMVAKVGSVFGPTGELKLLGLTEDAKHVWTATIQVGDSEPLDAVAGKALYVS
jgi:hypothetical protein